MILIRQLLHFITYLSGEGSWRLREHEKAVLNAAIDILSERHRQLVEQQLKEKFFIERIPDGRINVLRFYRPKPELKVEGVEFDDLLFRVHIIVNGRKQISHVVFYRGYLFSIEMKNPGKFYEGNSLAVEKVLKGKSSQSYTEAIDRLEHGKN